MSQAEALMLLHIQSHPLLGRLTWHREYRFGAEAAGGPGKVRELHGRIKAKRGLAAADRLVEDMRREYRRATMTASDGEV